MQLFFKKKIPAQTAVQTRHLSPISRRKRWFHCCK